MRQRSERSDGSDVVITGVRGKEDREAEVAAEVRGEGLQVQR